jgi:NAD(P)-dependent dehydrogenase (short-subunit alcohol dehydrogenase family)
LSGSTVMAVALEERQHDIVDYLLTKTESPEWKPRHVLVTGGDRGIGFAICANLFDQGHRVMLTCRSEETGSRVVQDLKQLTRHSKVGFITGNLSSLQGTRQLASLVLEIFPTVNVFINNVGIWPTKKELNENGLEMAFMVNYMAPYILCKSLIP